MTSNSLSLDASESTSRSLLQRVKQDDPDAWRRLSALYGPLVYRWARKAGLQDTDAVDIVQEVFRAVAEGIEGFRREQVGDSFRGWLWGITRNKLADHFRRQAQGPTAAGGAAALEQFERAADSIPGDAHCPVSANLARRALELMKTDFEERTWRAFWRVAVDGLSPAEVAAELGFSVASVYAAKSRVLSRLRAELAGLAD